MWDLRSAIKFIHASIVIPSLNSPLIARVIDSLLAQDEVEAIGEILVVGKDQGNLIGNREKVRFIDTSAQVSASRARNIGVDQAVSELIVFLDSDCLTKPRWLAEHLSAQRSGQMIVSGTTCPA